MFAQTWEPFFLFWFLTGNWSESCCRLQSLCLQQREGATAVNLQLLYRVARFFLTQYTKTILNCYQITKIEIYQMAVIYSEWPFQGPPKFTQIDIFWFENIPSGTPASLLPDPKGRQNFSAKCALGTNLQNVHQITNYKATRVQLLCNPPSCVR
jgi:hypothetical protein